MKFTAIMIAVSKPVQHGKGKAIDAVSMELVAGEKKLMKMAINAGLITSILEQ